MPTYEFRCPQGHLFEKFVRKISDSPSELPCPECGQVAARQMSGGAGLLFKGSGFYLTDYGKNAHRSGAPKSDAKSGDGSSGGDAKNAETKKDAGAAPKSSDAPAASSGSSTSEKKASPKKPSSGTES